MFGYLVLGVVALFLGAEYMVRRPSMDKEMKALADLAFVVMVTGFFS